MDFGEMVNPPLPGQERYDYSQPLGAEDQEINFEEGHVTFTKTLENFGPGCDDSSSPDLHDVTKNGEQLQARDRSTS